MASYHSHLIASLFLTGITTFLLGTFVYWRKGAQNIGRLFFLWCCSISWWSLHEGVLITLRVPDDVLFWGRVMMAGDIFLPTLFVHFVLTWLDQRVNWKAQTALYAVSFTLAVLCFTPFMVPSASKRVSVPYFIDPGSLFPILLVYFAVCVLYAQFQLWKAYRSASGQTQTKFGYFFWSSVVGFIGGCMNFLLVYEVETLPALYSYGTYAVPMFVAATTYAIVRYRLMDITVAVNKGLAYGVLLALIVIPTYLVALIGQHATLFSLPVIFSATLVFACGLWLLVKNPTRATNRTFFLICVSVCIWMYSIAMVYASSSPQKISFWEKLAYIGVASIPAFFYHFSTCARPAKQRHVSTAAVYAMWVVFLALIPTSYLVDGQYAFFWGAYPKAGPLHPVFLGYFALTSIVAMRTLYHGDESSQSSLFEGITIDRLFWTFVLGYMACIDFLPSYGIEMYPVGYVFITIWIATVTYGVVLHRAQDLAVDVQARIWPYAQGAVLIGCLYLVTLLFIRLFTGSTEYLLAGLLIVTFSIFAGRFDFLRQRTEKAIERALFRERFDAYETLTAFSKSLVSILDLRRLAQEIVHTLARVLQTQNASLFLLDQEKDTYDLVTSYGSFPASSKLDRIPARDDLLRHLLLTKGALVREELEQQGDTSSNIRSVVQTMRSLHAAVCLPLVNKERLIGFCTLGSRRNFRMFSHQDLDLLQSLAHNAAIALDNAMLYEQWKRSQALMRRTDRLRSLETIAAGFAHEVRNPLTSVKTFVQLAPLRKEDGEFMEYFGGIVCEDVARIERLIEEILDYARYMEPKFKAEDLNEIVKSCLYFIGIKADHNRITITKDLSDGLPPANLDRQQIKQVLLNLLMNALEAMEGSGGRLTVRTHRLEKQQKAWVQIEISDTGCGIPSADLEHIFDPFHTTKHASTEREGTGLGLAIVHQIVHEHGGYIDVTSEVGRGTTFWVNLPSEPPSPQQPQLQKLEQAARSSHG